MILSCAKIFRDTHQELTEAHEAELKQRLHDLIDVASMSQFLTEGDLSRLPVVETELSARLPRMEDVLRLSLRRRVPLPNVEPGHGAQATIGGEGDNSPQRRSTYSDGFSITLPQLCVHFTPH